MFAIDCKSRTNNNWFVPLNYDEFDHANVFALRWKMFSFSPSSTNNHDWLLVVILFICEQIFWEMSHLNKYFENSILIFVSVYKYYSLEKRVYTAFQLKIKQTFHKWFNIWVFTIPMKSKPEIFMHVHSIDELEISKYLRTVQTI